MRAGKFALWVRYRGNLMRFLKTVKNYFFYCGIEKDEYNAVKKDAYVSNYKVWRLLHVLMVVAFAFLYLSSLVNELLESNKLFYLVALAYSVIASVLFLVMKNGLSIMNIGAIKSSAINVVAGISGLFCVIMHAKRKRSEIDRYIRSCAASESFFRTKNRTVATTEYISAIR